MQVQFIWLHSIEEDPIYQQITQCSRKKTKSYYILNKTKAIKKLEICMDLMPFDALSNGSEGSINKFWRQDLLLNALHLLIYYIELEEARKQPSSSMLKSLSWLQKNTRLSTFSTGGYTAWLWFINTIAKCF